jgi:hypothetical protein
MILEAAILSVREGQAKTTDIKARTSGSEIDSWLLGDQNHLEL